MLRTETNFNPKQKYRFCWEAQNTLELHQNGLSFPVKAVSNFPWSHPENFVSIQNTEGEELLILESIEELTESSKRALRKALGQVRFVLQVQGIESVTEEADFRVWKVKTQVGPRQFVTKIEDWPQAVDDNRVLITDVAGDLYEVKEVSNMDSRSQKLLWALVDFE